MSNDPKLIDALNRAVRKADQAIRASLTTRPDPQAAADAINSFSKVVQLLDARIAAIEEKLKDPS
ncbi:hypothetical protein [Pseudomonas shirazica]|uniref:hypothetical protein n=1 Tax=Pseudomonas shirazica TaxID=1940636 RepID=UPI001C27CE54|nr:hypothetical protein [Pseudomonas shirazica]